MDVYLKSYFDKIILKILLLTMICSIGIGLLLFHFHTSAQEEMLSTEIGNRSTAVGNSIAYTIEKALQMGIPFDEMVEVSEFLNENEKKSQDVSYIAITDTEGNTVYKSDQLQNSLKGSFKRFALSAQDSSKKLKPYDVLNYHNIPIKITANEHHYGYLHLGVSKKVTTDRIKDIYYDILTILLVAMIAGAEFFLFIFRNKIQLAISDLILTMRRIANSDFTLLTCIRTTNSISAVTEKFNNLISIIASRYSILKSQLDKIPAGDDQFLILKELLSKFSKNYVFADSKAPQQEALVPLVENIRLSAFLMVLAETVLVAILPSYASQFYNSTWGLSKEFISSSPILVFMLASTLGVILASKISYRAGFRKSILIGLYIATAGYVVSFLTSGLLFMLLARAITALGYGIAYASIQNYIAAYAHSDRKIQSYAIFAVAFGAAYICGAPIGGILVDNIGYNSIFAIAAFASGISIWFTKQFVIDFSNLTQSKIRQTKKTPGNLLKNGPFVVTLIFVGLPARLMFSSLICLFYPLYLRSLGFSQSSVGRNLMIFGVITFAFSSLAAKTLEKFKNYNSHILFISIFMIGISILIPVISRSSFAPGISLFIYAVFAVINTCAMMSSLEEFSSKEYENHTKGTILTYYFVAERIGMIIGPVLISNLLHIVSFTKTMIILSVFILMCSVIYGGYQFFTRKSRKEYFSKGIES